MPKEKKIVPARITNRITFEAAIWAAIEPYVIKWMDDEREWRKAHRERDPKGRLPLHPTNRSVRRDDLLLHRIFQAYREVTTSFETLINIPFYMRHLPRAVSKRATKITWRGLFVSRSAWVRYHIENYFHELYVFQNRVEALFTLLRRSYRKQTFSTSLNEKCDRLEKALKVGFSDALKLRGRHVHERRFDDTSLHIIELSEFLIRQKGISARNHTELFRDTLTEKSFWMADHNGQIRKWLDEAGVVLGHELFTKDRAFRFPLPPTTK
jgi:hypothetical protein